MNDLKTKDYWIDKAVVMVVVVAAIGVAKQIYGK